MELNPGAKVRLFPMQQPKASGALMQGIFSGLGTALGGASQIGGPGEVGKAKQGGPKGWQ